MRVLRFEVQGFKNLVETVVLDRLGEINVIHGDNNVGKSNLLESMHLFFRLLAEDIAGPRLPFGDRPVELGGGEFAKTGYDMARVFNAWRAMPIEMTCAFSVGEDELRRAGIEPLIDCSKVTITARLERMQDRVACTIPRFEFGDGTDAARSEGSRRFAHRFALFLTRNYLVQDAEARPTFALVDENRAVRGLAAEAPAGLLSDALQLRLYDAKNSREALRFERWRLFARLLADAAPNLPAGAFDVLYDREAAAAALVFETDAGRLDATLFGSGVQQLAAQLGQLLTTDAAIVAIEEPECNLRYALQVTLRDLFGQIVRHPHGPSQIFLTSHSPAFEVGDHFHAMWLEDGIPRLARRPIEQAPGFTGLDHAPVPPTAEKAGRSFVTSDGLVEVPPFVLDALGLPRGGGVFFAVRRDDGHVEMLSHAQLLALGGLDDGE